MMLIQMQIDSSQVCHNQVFELSRKHWGVMYYSTLTSLLRATPDPSSGMDISSECFQAAQLSLQSHICCFSGYETTGFLTDADYANWSVSLLFTIFRDAPAS